jgi:succinate-semialdehyde dehydrogenase/glutarate-semialdehyde dehydrogenase
MSTAIDERTVVDAIDTRLYVAGSWRDSSSGGTLAVEDPSTGDTLR